MAMDGDGRRAEWELKVMEILNECQQRNEPMFVLAMEVAKCVDSAGLGLPSAELGELIVTQLCLPHHNHIRHKVYLWKFLDHALSSSLLSPLQILALLTSRVLPNRMSQPEAYRLYLELVSRYVLSVDWFNSDICSEKIIKSTDVALQLSQNYGVQVLELGHVLALCFFCIMLALIDSTLCDWGLQITTAGDTTSIIKSADNMDVDDGGIQFCRRTDNCEQLRRSNSLKAFEVVGKLSESRKAMVFLRLVYLNMPGKFNALLQRMQFLEACKLSSLNLKSANQVLTNISLNIQKAMRFEYMSNKCQLVRMLIDIKPYKPVPSYNSDSGRFACWVPFDITLENAMDGKQFPVTSTIDVLTETIYTLKEFNDASWQETFLALWLSALRVVQRERDPLEGPVPHLDSRLCILLCITPLAIARVLKDDVKCDTSLQDNIEPGNVVMGDGNELNDNDHALRKQGLISSLQFLGHYTALLHPPASVVSEANNAVAKAAMFISSSKVLKGETTGISYHDDSIKEGAGDMRHLIVEACLARNLIDTSAYFWPQYVPTSVTLSSNPSIVQESPWSRFMEGASLTPTLISALMAVPASSLAELEKLYGTALNGLEEEKSAAAKVLCGASLRRGWNIQEHAVQFVVKLLSPPVPPNFNRLRSHLVDYISMLSALLSGASSIDTVHILSLHGVVPEVAASLMPLCENFGSIVPTSSSTADSSSYTVFSSAFLFLLRLWKFYRPPLEHCITGRRGAIGGDLSLEYLLLLRNSRIGSNYSATHDETARNNAIHESTSRKPMLLDFHPKLKAWYCQNKSCTASTLSGLCCGNPVQEVANEILSMILSKMSKSGTLSGDSSVLSGSSCSGPSASNGEDTHQRPLLSAWEVLEAMPFVLEAILTACAHGRLSSRDLTTGLRDLVDYLPASLAVIVSYFAAEITRGTWKAVSMNGIDWPSPAANLQSIESEIREILAAAHVHIPSCLSGVSEATLPLPMAALVSLTITFKLDKSLEYIHAVAGPALENCASGCPWPSMPIISSLWSQKVRRWHDFIVVSASRSVFRQNHEAVSQLLRSCFTSFLGSLNFSSASSLISQHGVNGLLGSFISAPGQYPRVAPGFLYLRSTRGIHHIQNLNQVIVDLVANSAWELASGWSNHIKSQRLSLAGVVDRAKEVGTLGASLLVVGGGQQMVQKLYQETIPTWLLSWKEKNGNSNAVSRLLEGYSMAYLLVLSGALIWGVGSKPPSWSFSRRLHGFQVHMDFIAAVLEGNVSVGCDAATWKAYVCCVVGLVVSHTPMWIQEVKVATLRKLATGLVREWHECDLALSLVEKGGVAAMGAAAELVHLL